MACHFCKRTGSMVCGINSCKACGICEDLANAQAPKKDENISK